MKIIKLIKDVLAPKKCYSCWKEWHFLCENCFEKIEKHKPFCYICKKESRNFWIHEKCKKNIFFDKIIISFHYRESVIKKMITNAKFYYSKDVLEEFGTFLSQLIKKNLKTQNTDKFLIIPVPMYFLKKMMRSYNQSEILAKKISEQLWIKYEKNVIKKLKNTTLDDWGYFLHKISIKSIYWLPP